MRFITLLMALGSMLIASTMALADGPTVYGRVAFGFTSTSGEMDKDDKDKLEDNMGGRLGVKGTNDLGNGMTVDYLMEYKASGDSEGLSLRHSNLTLNGSFGQFRLGKQTGVLYRYIGANTDQSWALGGDEYYAIASNPGDGTGGLMNSNHYLRMKNIAAYRFGAGPGGDDPITFDIQIQSVDQSVAKVPGKAPVIANETAEIEAADAVAPVAAKDDGESIDSVTIGAATSLGPVKLQLAYVDENGSDATDDRSPSLLSFGFRAPLGSAEIRGHMTEVDSDRDDYDDAEAWGLLVMNDFGGGYFGMIGVGNYEKGVQAKRGDAGADDNDDSNDILLTHGDDGNRNSMYASLTKSFGGGLSAVAEYKTVSKIVSKPTYVDPTADTPVQNGSDDNKQTTNTLKLSLIQSF